MPTCQTIAFNGTCPCAYIIRKTASSNGPLCIPFTFIIHWPGIGETDIDFLARGLWAGGRR
jgi:hypothetical protein